MIRNVKLFVAVHVAVVVALYAVAMCIGGGWVDAPTLPLEGMATRFASLASPTSGSARVPLPADSSGDRLPRHDLELRSASQDQPAPWVR
jgi:hypothetical protein